MQLQRAAAVALTFSCACAVAAKVPCGGAPTLQHVFCDVKTALHDGTLNASNAAPILTALVANMRCDWLRIAAAAV